MITPHSSRGCSTLSITGIGITEESRYRIAVPDNSICGALHTGAQVEPAVMNVCILRPVQIHDRKECDYEKVNEWSSAIYRG